MGGGVHVVVALVLKVHLGGFEVLVGGYELLLGGCGLLLVLIDGRELPFGGVTDECGE